MTEPTRMDVDCRGKTALVEIDGAGLDVVLVGSAVPMAWARPAAKALADRGFRVVNFDYGVAEEPPQPRTAPDQVDDVVAVMHATGTPSAVVVGLSRGAMTAFGVAARHPDLVSRLVLVFPVAGWADTIDITSPDPEPLDGEDPDAFLRRSLGSAFSEEFLASHLEDAASLFTRPPGSVVRVDRHDEEKFSDSDSVSSRTLVVEGGRDEIVSWEHPARYLSAIPGAEHVLIEEAPHGWIMEDPEGFATVVEDFARPQAPSDV